MIGILQNDVSGIPIWDDLLQFSQGHVLSYGHQLTGAFFPQHLAVVEIG
jgi:hypothetical protein